MSYIESSQKYTTSDKGFPFRVTPENGIIVPTRFQSIRVCCDIKIEAPRPFIEGSYCNILFYQEGFKITLDPIFRIYNGELLLKKGSIFLLEGFCIDNVIFSKVTTIEAVSKAATIENKKVGDLND